MKYSFVVPVYFDGYLAPRFCAELERVMCEYLTLSPLSLSDVIELIFVNDGSADDSLQMLLELKKRYQFVQIIDLSRNFGQHAAIACGMRAARGDLVLRSNIDMQDPLFEVPKLIDTLVQGDYDLVVGQYAKRRSPAINRLTAHVYFFLFRFLTGFQTPQNTSPLRVMSRSFVDAYNALTEKSRFPQGLDQWLGFRHKYIAIAHHKRIDNRSSYNFWSRSKLALNGILYFSDRPLQLIASAGFIVASIGTLLGLYIALERLFGVEYLPGYASLASIALIAFGIQVGCIGVVGLYISKIFREVQNRPLYVVRKVFR